MIAIFIAAFVAGLTATAILLLTLTDDMKEKGIRPLFLLVIAASCWLITYPALVVQEPSTTIVMPAYNVIISGGVSATIQQPAYNVISTGNLLAPPAVLNMYLYFWVAILLIHFALGVIYLYELGEGSVKDAINMIIGKKPRTAS